MADWADELQEKLLINACVNHLDSFRTRIGSSIADALRTARAEALEEAATLTTGQAQVFRDEAHDQKVWGNGAMSKRALAIASYFDMHAAAIRALKEKSST